MSTVKASHSVDNFVDPCSIGSGGIVDAFHPTEEGARFILNHP
jgi:hypothetical protein